MAVAGENCVERKEKRPPARSGGRASAKYLQSAVTTADTVSSRMKRHPSLNQPVSKESKT